MPREKKDFLTKLREINFSPTDDLLEFYDFDVSSLYEEIVNQEEERTALAWGLLYPESCNPNWRTILSELHICYALSPLHDSDVRANGEPKKAHYHLIIDFSYNKQVKSWFQFNQIFEAIGGVFSPILRQSMIHNKRLAYRYLVHLDDADKFQYDYNDIVSYGLAEAIPDIIFAEVDLKTKVLPKIYQFIIENHVCYYCDFIFWCTQEDPEWAECVSRNRYDVVEFIKSISYYCDQHGLEKKTVLLDGLMLN